ncbi:hypothetical protein ACQKWADRAFT_310615 [Trichoderma austrokoningii]
MNNDAAPNSSARIPDRLSPPGTGPNNDTNDAEADTHERSRSRQRSRSKRRSKKKQNPGLAKKLGFLTHLLKTLDLVVFAELSSMYYMECSMLMFMARAIPQYMYLSPKDESFALLMPATHIHVLVILVPNLMCILGHLFDPLALGPDYHRGYQHGGMFIDFVGQMPSQSRLYYILFDLVILAIQSLMLSIHNQREGLRVALKTFRPLSNRVLEPIPGRSPEDLDAEERGVSRHESGVTFNETDEIELQQLDRQGNGEGPDDRSEPLQAATGDDPNDESLRTHLSDIMSSGNAVLNEYHVIHTMKTALMKTGGSTALSLQAIGYRATMARIRTRRRGTTLRNQITRPSD